jgi:hypothetical protein
LTGILIFINTAVTVAVLNVLLVADLKEDVFNLICIGDRVCVDNDQGVIEILEVCPSVPQSPQATTLPGIHFDHNQLGLKPCKDQYPSSAHIAVSAAT